MRSLLVPARCMGSQAARGRSYRPVLLLLVLCLTFRAAAAVPPCCSYELNGEVFAYPKCDCLYKNTAPIMVNETTTANSTEGEGDRAIRNFHWLLDDYSLIHHGTPNISFIVSPCGGDVLLDLKFGFYQSHNILKSFTSDPANAGDLNVITLPMKYSEQYLVVNSSTKANYSVQLFIPTAEAQVPPLPENRTVWAEQVNNETVDVYWNTVSGGAFEYHLVAYSIPKDPEHPCYHNASTDLAVVKNNTQCILWTTCGLMQNLNVSKFQGWEEINPSAEAIRRTMTFGAGDVFYINVLVRKGDDFIMPYAGTRLIVGRDTVTQLAEDSTMIYVGLATLGGSAFLILFVMAMKVSEDKKFRKSIANRFKKAGSKGEKKQ